MEYNKKLDYSNNEKTYIEGKKNEDKYENEIINYFNVRINPDVKRKRYDRIDFSYLSNEDNSKVNVELKCRDNAISIETYPTTILNLDKFFTLFYKVIDEKEAAIVVIKFTEGLYYYKFNEQSFLDFKYKKVYIPQRKIYSECMEIPISMLIKM